MTSLRSLLRRAGAAQVSALRKVREILNYIPNNNGELARYQPTSDPVDRKTWDIDIQTDKGHLALRMGGNVLEIDGKPSAGENTIMGEYPALYARMADLVRTGASDVDLAPMVHVADALTLGERITTDAFDF